MKFRTRRYALVIAAKKLILAILFSLDVSES